MGVAQTKFPSASAASANDAGPNEVPEVQSAEEQPNEIEHRGKCPCSERSDAKRVATPQCVGVWEGMSDREFPVGTAFMAPVAVRN
jgi:hypothetical protein